MSYIERDGILKDLQEDLELDSIYYNDDVNKGITEGLKMAIKNIKRFPTSDVVEVVRCGQCKHWKINPHNLYGGYCRYSEGASIDHYCSYGERRENDNT